MIHPINNPVDNLQNQTDQLKKSMTDLNNTLLELVKTQDGFGKGIEKNGEDFKDQTRSIDGLTTSLKELNKQLAETNEVIDQSKVSLGQNKELISGLQKVYDSLTKSQKENSSSVKALANDLSLLSANSKDQEKALAQSKKTFDYHKASVDAAKSAINKLKSSNKDLAPAIEDVTNGFNMMKSGLAVVKTGFGSMGDAIKTTGFGLLVLVLQSVVEYFTKTTDGAKKLKGGIAAISLVIKTVKDTVSHILSSLGRDIADAVSNPAETVKKVWNAVIENISNRFKGVAIFFKGLFAGNIKEMGDGAIQMGTGITNGLDKINNAFQTVKKDIKAAGSTIVDAYNKAANASDKAVEKIREGQSKIHNALTGGKKLTARADALPTLNEPKVNIQPSESSSSTQSSAVEQPKKSPNDSVQLEDSIMLLHNSGDLQTEFILRQQQLDKERMQAEEAAKVRNESVLKVDLEYNEKQKQLDKGVNYKKVGSVK